MGANDFAHTIMSKDAPPFMPLTLTQAPSTTDR